METIFSLDCPYYNKSFNTVSELIQDVLTTGMDPNYEITKNGRGIGEEVISYLQ